MDTSPAPQKKKGLGVLGWLGIGCGGIVLIIVIVIVIGVAKLGPGMKNFASDFQANPTLATTNMMVKASFGQLEIVASDDVNKRYTVRGKADGKLVTIYWDAKTQKPVTVEGDFSAIPADANPSPAPATPAPQ